MANDSVLLLNLLAGSVLRGQFALVLCVSAVLRAVVSVAGSGGGGRGAAGAWRIPCEPWSVLHVAEEEGGGRLVHGVYRVSL